MIKIKTSNNINKLSLNSGVFVMQPLRQGLQNAHMSFHLTIHYAYKLLETRLSKLAFDFNKIDSNR